MSESDMIDKMNKLFNPSGQSAVQVNDLPTMSTDEKVNMADYVHKKIMAIEVLGYKKFIRMLLYGIIISDFFIWALSSAFGLFYGMILVIIFVVLAVLYLKGIASDIKRLREKYGLN